MKKRSKQWNEFGQIIDIVDIRVGKQLRMLEKLRKEHDCLRERIDELWYSIGKAQACLKDLNLSNENDALSRLFRRRESIKSRIESLFFDFSIARYDAEELERKIALVNAEKMRLEKRKNALDEMRIQLM